jgi:adenosylcobinamide-GDP ribazoletransferase
MRSALAFLTIAGRASSPAAGTLAWFPVVGALLGLAVGGVWVGAGHAWPLAVAAALALAADAILTGGLHWDGLADTGDGLLPALPVERRLAVMADPRIGAFGAVTVAVMVLLRFVTLGAGPASAWIIAALWCLSRATVALVVLFGSYARSEGLASAFHDTRRPRRGRALIVVVLGLAIAVPLALIKRPGHGLAALGAEVAAIAGLAWFAERRLGGYTGDVLGAQIVLGETIGLLLWSARW